MTDLSASPKPSDSQIVIDVRLTPRGGRNIIVGWDSELRQRLIVRVSAAAVDGRANEALIGVLADSLRVAKSSIELFRGQKSRNKTIRLHMNNEAYQSWAETIPIV